MFQVSFVRYISFIRNSIRVRLPEEYGYTTEQRICDECFLNLNNISEDEKGFNLPFVVLKVPSVYGQCSCRIQRRNTAVKFCDCARGQHRSQDRQEGACHDCWAVQSLLVSREKGKKTNGI